MKNAQFWKLGVVGGMFIIFVGSVYALGGTTEARDVGWIALSPTAQVQLDEFEAKVATERCWFTKNLATAKLLDDMNGVAIDGIDRNDLAKKRDMVCDGKAAVEPGF